MLYLKLKDKKTREQFYKYEKRKLIQKFIFINLIQKLKYVSNLKGQNNSKRNKILYLLSFYNHKYLKSNSKTRLLRRCLLTNRNRSVLRPFGLSRIVLREFIQFGILPGYKKAAW